MILVTGSEGLIGSHLTQRLKVCGLPVRTFDIRSSGTEDVRDQAALEIAMKDVEGIVHLAAVSRVVWGEQNPALCNAVNVDALKGLLEIASRKNKKPWVLFSSSREVYGQAKKLPVQEDDAYAPLNVYARSKVAGELLMKAAAEEAGLKTYVCRFSSVYGWALDHADRVSMAFATTAVRGGVMKVEGLNHTFDFVDIEDVIEGVLKLIEVIRIGESLPPIHFVSGIPTTLSQLAELASKYAHYPVSIESAPERSYDIHGFIGNPARAYNLLGWKAKISIEDGLPRLIQSIADLDKMRSNKKTSAV